MIRGTKAQIAIEFIVLYAVILIIFVIVFSVLTSQRAVQINSQEYSLLQLQAQEIASYINYALTAGSGYTATLLLSAGTVQATYNLSISTTGVVIVTATNLGHPITAYAFSSGRDLVINGVLQSSSNGISVYSVPTYTGSINISNFGGVVYVDKAPVSNLAQAARIVPLNLKESYVANFNGRSSSIMVQNTPALDLPPTTSTSATITAWVRQLAQTPGEVLAEGPNNMGYEVGFGLGGCQANAISILKQPPTGSCIGSYPSDGLFHQLAVVINSTAISAYVDGKYNGSVANINPINPIDAPVTIGVGSNKLYFNGQLANLQIYNISLTANQVAALYSLGLSGAPVTSSNVVAWWPLNDNTNDYSGNNQNGQSANIVYSSAAELDLQVLAADGKALTRNPVGLIISNGVIANSGNTKLVLSTNGIANVVVIYNTTAPNMTAYLFNGNLTTASLLSGWWPFTRGTAVSNIIYDLSPTQDNAIASNVLWGYRNDQASFAAARFPNNPQLGTSHQGAITINSIGSLLQIPSSKNITLVAWALFGGGTPSRCEGIAGSGGQTSTGVQLIGYSNGGSCSDAYVDGVSLVSSQQPLLSPGNWTMLSLVVNNAASSAYLYENNVIVANALLAGSNDLTPSGGLYYIGSTDPTGGLGTFNGIISNVQIYSTPLTPSQILQLYSEGPLSVPLLNSRLAGWWSLAGTPNDSSGNYNNVNYNNGNAINNNKLVYNVSFLNLEYLFSYNTTPLRKIATFNGVGSASIPYSALISPQSTPFTISFWFSSSKGSNQSFAKSPLVTSAASPSGSGISTYLFSDGGSQSGFNSIIGYSGGGASSMTLSYNFPFIQNSWYHAVVSCSTTLCALYINGMNVSSNIYSGSIGGLFTGPSSALTVGTTSGAAQFKGQITNMQIYNTALTPVQVAQLYEQGPLPVQYSARLSIG